MLFNQAVESNCLYSWISTGITTQIEIGDIMTSGNAYTKLELVCLFILYRNLCIYPHMRRMCNTYTPVYTPISTLRPVMQSPLRMSFGRSVNHTHRDLSETDVGWQLLRLDESAWALDGFSWLNKTPLFFIDQLGIFTIWAEMGGWWQVVAFSVYRQNDEIPLCTPRRVMHIRYTVSWIRRNPPPNGYLARKMETEIPPFRVMSPRRSRDFTPEFIAMYCDGEMKKMITFLSGSSAFIHVMTSKENMPHVGEKKHANDNIMYTQLYNTIQCSTI